MSQIASIPNINFSALYIALIVLLVVPLMIQVIRLRISGRVSIGDGGDKNLALQIRIHGNYVENVPFAFALLLILPLIGASAWLIHIVGIAFIVGRICHILGLKVNRNTALRQAGMILTFTTYIAGSLGVLWRLLF